MFISKDNLVEGEYLGLETYNKWYMKTSVSRRYKNHQYRTIRKEEEEMIFQAFYGTINAIIYEYFSRVYKVYKALEIKIYFLLILCK